MATEQEVQCQWSGCAGDATEHPELVSPCWADARCLAVGGTRAREPRASLQRVEVYKNVQCVMCVLKTMEAFTGVRFTLFQCCFLRSFFSGPAWPCRALPCLVLSCLGLPWLALPWPCPAPSCLGQVKSCLALACLARPCLALPRLVLVKSSRVLPWLALACLAGPCPAPSCLGQVKSCLALASLA